MDRGWEVDLHAAVHCAGLQLSRILRGQRQTHAAIAGFHIESLAFPSLAGELDAKPSILRVSLEVAANVAQPDAAVRRAQNRAARNSSNEIPPLFVLMASRVFAGTSR